MTIIVEQMKTAVSTSVMLIELTVVVVIIIATPYAEYHLSGGGKTEGA